MASEPCTIETTSLYITAPGETSEIEHPCGKPDGHAGEHACMFCEARWGAEATC